MRPASHRAATTAREDGLFGTARRTGSAPVTPGTLIGPGLTVEGELQFHGAVRIEGTVRGAVCVPIDGEGALFIGAGGSVAGDVRASEVTVEGLVEGSVFATGKVVVGPAGRIAGEVHCGSLEMAPGAEVQGLLAPMAHTLATEPMAQAARAAR
jgi:cytoskeletal protein CcmA (bactofilin family)